MFDFNEPHACHEEHSCIDIVPIFSHLDKEEKDEVIAITNERQFARGETIYQAGDSGRALYVIHQGSVRVFRLSPTGKEQVIRIAGPGDFLGELTVLSDQELNEYAVTNSPVTMCYIDGHDLQSLMAKYPSIAMKILEVMSRRLERAEGLIEDINLHSADYRLSRALLELAGDSLVVNLPSTKGDFASSLGMTQETLSRKLSSWQDDEIIDMRGQRRIYVLNRQALEKMIDV